MSLEKSETVKDWKRRKATNAIDPFETIKRGDELLGKSTFKFQEIKENTTKQK